MNLFMAPESIEALEGGQRAEMMGRYSREWSRTAAVYRGGAMVAARSTWVDCSGDGDYVDEGLGMGKT